MKLLVILSIFYQCLKVVFARDSALTHSQREGRRILPQNVLSATSDLAGCQDSRPGLSNQTIRQGTKAPSGHDHNASMIVILGPDSRCPMEVHPLFGTDRPRH